MGSDFLPTDERRAFAGDADDADDGLLAPLHYRAISWPAVLGLVLSPLGLLVTFGWLFLVFPVVGAVLAAVSLRRIREASEQLAGSVLAQVGLGACIAFAVAGMAANRYVNRQGVPVGYQAVAWDALQPNLDNPGELIPPAAFALEPSPNDPRRQVFLTGYVYPGRQSVGLTEFILVPSITHCEFCSTQLKSTEMIMVRLQGDRTLDFRSDPVHVGGKFAIDRAQAGLPFGGLPYTLEANYVR